VKSNEAISELLLTIKERRVRNSEKSFLESVYKGRLGISELQAEMKFLPMVSKYFFEIGLVLITVTITVLQFYFSESSRAIANLVVFLAASGRIAPAVLRIQQGIVGIKNNLGGASLTQELIHELDRLETSDFHEDDPEPRSRISALHFFPSIKFENVSFKYTKEAEFSIKNVSVEFPACSFTALVGPSGGGKSTLIDLCLGFYKPSQGSILVSGQEPNGFIKMFPGKIGFVPQETLIVKNTLRENILLGIDVELTAEEWESLIKSCRLESLVQELPNGLDTHLGEFGSQLSGGQKQRIGIARAMVLRPQLIFLDEATSALDAETELVLSKLIYGDRDERQRNNRTVIAIAHRLSSIREADNIIFVADGEIRGQGNFDKLRSDLPSFAYQAQLMGID
jgi:ABC-type multidrug transport system fused ATPase/permease subunit